MIAFDNLADHGALELPTGAERLDVGQAARLDARKHALLRLGDHDLEGLHVVLAQRHLGEIESHADRTTRCHLRRGRGEPGGAEILQTNEDVVAHQFERGFDQALAHVRVADLDRRALLVATRIDVLRGEHGCSTNAIPPGTCAKQHDEVADTSRGRALEIGGLEDADTHRIDEARLLVTSVETHFATDVSDANAIAVVTDTAHGSVQEAPRTLGCWIAKAERVENRDRTGTHRENIAQNAADTGCGALKWLNCRRVVVALDLEGHAEAVADVDDARVFAGTLQNGRSGRWKTTQNRLRMLVAAVLAPKQ